MTDQVTKEDLDEVKEAVKENSRALRGSNGTPGVVAEISTVKHDVKEIKDNHLAHLETNIKTEILLMETRIMAAIDKKFSERSQSVMSQWVRPIIIPLIGSAITAMIILWGSHYFAPAP